MTKLLITSKDPFDVVVSAVKQAGLMVRPTYGPAANKVVIAKQVYGMVVDDGVQIMRDLELPDTNENAILKVLKETAIKTNDRAGDGTTGSMIMLESIIVGVSEQTHRYGHKIEAELKEASKEAVEQLRKMSKPVKTKEELVKVARVSYNDEEVAEIIADTWHKVGPDGVVTIEGSVTAKTTAEMAEGLSFKRGYVSPYMVTDGSRMEAVVEKPYILITDYRLTEAADILPIMNLLASKNILNLVVIAENIEQGALATMVVNKMQGKFNCVAINAPASDNMTVMLDDIAKLVGGRVFSSERGDKLENATIADLGRAQRFVAKRDSSLIVKPKGNAAIVKKLVKDLQTAMANETDEKNKSKLRERLGLFTNQIAVIKVGGETDNEQKAKRYKVEDAVASVRAAFRGGVVAGGGVALARVNTQSELLNRALRRPHLQLLENMEIDKAPKLKEGEALNVITGEIGPWMKVGVLDPVDVLIAAVESAVSIASIMVTISGLIVEPPVEPKRE